jgi:hypothetical protein
MPRKKLTALEKADHAIDRIVELDLSSALYNFAAAKFVEAYPDGDENDYEDDPQHEFAAELDAFCSSKIYQLVDNLKLVVDHALEVRKAECVTVELH